MRATYFWEAKIPPGCLAYEASQQQFIKYQCFIIRLPSFIFINQATWQFQFYHHTFWHIMKFVGYLSPISHKFFINTEFSCCDTVVGVLSSLNHSEFESYGVFLSSGVHFAKWLGVDVTCVINPSRPQYLPRHLGSTHLARPHIPL